MNSKAPENRNLGEQPIAALMAERELKAHDLVAASGGQVTHKMVTRACKGRWLTPNSRLKVQAAFEQTTGEAFVLADLFSY